MSDVWIDVVVDDEDEDADEKCWKRWNGGDDGVEEGPITYDRVKKVMEKKEPRPSVSRQLYFYFMFNVGVT